MNKNQRFLILGAGLLLAMGLGCSRQQAVLANIGSRVITSEDFIGRLKQLPPQYQAYIKTDDDKKNVLDALVKEQLVVQEAREKNIDKDKAVQAKINSVVDQILLEEMIKKVRETQLKPTEAEDKTYYDQHSAEFSGPARIKVAHILVKDKALADKLLAELHQGGDFASLAKENSLDPGSGKNGGEMDFFAKGEMVPEFEKAAFALENPGQLSGVVKTAFGFHIIKLIAKREAGQKTLDEAKADIERKVEKEKFDKWLEGLKTKWHVKVNYDKLKQVSLPVAAVPNNEGEK